MKLARLKFNCVDVIHEQRHLSFSGKFDIFEVYYPFSDHLKQRKQVGISPSFNKLVGFTVVIK